MRKIIVGGGGGTIITIMGSEWENQKEQDR